jgi:hypothetical protein
VQSLILIAAVDPDSAAWARWLQDVMTSWPAQLLILLLFAGLARSLARHGARASEDGLRNRDAPGPLRHSVGEASRRTPPLSSPAT